MNKKSLEIFTDGGASGNPGPAGIGVVIKDGTGTVFEISEGIGDATNNVAEYKAVIAALEQAIRQGAEKVFINTDSELVYYQLTGRYKVKNENLLVLVKQVQLLSRQIKFFEMRCIPREQNVHADRLAKQAIEKIKKQSLANRVVLQNVQQAKVVASKSIFGEESPSSAG